MIGLFFVSAGEFLNIKIVPTIDTIILNIILIFNIKHNIGIPINNKLEDNKHIQLLVACNPNEKILKTLYINKYNITSSNIFNNNDIVIIIINFEKVRYIPSKPYFISLSFTSL
ncbi:MAG: hypothetical protein Q4E75_04350 [bacterium]|nr:hypothetical protein [bacterium]